MEKKHTPQKGHGKKWFESSSMYDLQLNPSLDTQSQKHHNHMRHNKCMQTLQLHTFAFDSVLPYAFFMIAANKWSTHNIKAITNMQQI